MIWRTPGVAACASLVVAPLGGRLQLVGYGAPGCGGWDIGTGKRLWSLAPKVAGDFNVPTPLVVGAKVAFVSENNGARSVSLDGDGQPRAEAVFARLDPDMHSPVSCADRIFAVHKGKVTCLDAATLRPEWVAKDRSLQGHASRVLGDDVSTLAHPAVAGGRIYVRGPGELVCVNLGPP